LLETESFANYPKPDKININKTSNAKAMPNIMMAFLTILPPDKCLCKNS